MNEVQTPPAPGTMSKTIDYLHECVSPRNRDKNRHVRYCAECQVSEGQNPNDKELLRCLNCNVFCYCSLECQKRHSFFHNRDCNFMSRFKQRSLNVKFSALVIQSEYSGPHTETTTWNMRAHLYERVLDEYTECYEEIKGMGMSSEVGIQAHQDYYVVQARIPFLLAALGHDDHAITELAIMIDPSGQADRVPRSRHDDLLSDLFNERDLSPASWTCCFLLPLLLVKMRLVVELKSGWFAWSRFKKTNYFPEDVKLVVKEYLAVPTMQELVKQQRQLLAIAILLEQEDVLSGVRDGVAIVKEYFDESNQYSEDGLFAFLRHCFVQTQSMKNLLSELVEDEIADRACADLEWERCKADNGFAPIPLLPLFSATFSPT